jgi:hypothetical protein
MESKGDTMTTSKSQCFWCFADASTSIGLCDSCAEQASTAEIEDLKQAMWDDEHKATLIIGARVTWTERGLAHAGTIASAWDSGSHVASNVRTVEDDVDGLRRVVETRNLALVK